MSEFCQRFILTITPILIGYTKTIKKKLRVRDSASAAPAGDDRPSRENLEKLGPLTRFE